MPLALLLCAGCTPLYVETVSNDNCSDYVPPSMWDPTPHAPPPDSTQAGHVNFEIGEAGQLEKANSDKAGTKHIIITCERKKGEAAQRAKKKLEPWWKRIF